MGKTILTTHQSAILEQARLSQQITDRYYFTGGTALAHYYLHHRYSEDLDFFSRHEVNEGEIDLFFKRVRKSLKIKTVAKKKISGLFVYELTFSDNAVLKIDFNEYDFPQIERGGIDGALQVDSLYDIAINKLYTIFSRKKARDFIDLYFCLKPNEFSLEQLLMRIPDKFGVTIEPTSIITEFAAIQDLTEYPTMLVPFDREEMKTFFLNEAKKLDLKIFK